MAYSDQPFLISMIAETTVSSTALYRVAWHSELGVIVGDPGSTSIAAKPAGICYGYTHSTSTAAQERIPIAVGGIAKVGCISSTVAVGEMLGASSDGWGCTPTTNHFVLGRIISGSSAGAGMVKSVLLSNPMMVYSRYAGVGTT
jgi:hypothetical protein